MSIMINAYQTQAGTGSAVNGVTPLRTEQSTKPIPEKEEVSGDRVTLGASAREAVTYGDPRSTNVQRPDELQAMLEESERKAQEVIDLIVSMVKGQGATLRDVVNGDVALTADPQTIDAAKAAIAEDGEYGVQQVSQRILDFARAMIGDDPSRIEAVRAGVEKGFAQATEALGGKLPEISEKTYAAIMVEFDRWQKEGLPQTTEEKSTATVAESATQQTA